MAILPLMLTAQGLWLDPKELLQPLDDSWASYSGDYSGRRYSALTQIDKTNVKHLALAWTARMNESTGGRAGGAGTIVGGEGADFAAGGVTIKGSILEINDVLYVTAPDHVWAVDARDGRTIWHYAWKTKGGTHIANRGVGIYGDWLYFETPDDYVVSLDARTGKERWHKVIAPFEYQYFSTTAPMIIGNHVIVGTGNDLDSPGFLQSFDPEDGSLQWKFYTVPMKPGDPGESSWANLDAARHGGGQPWMPGAYDPETHLYYFGTGNPTPAYVTKPRGEHGDHLYTSSLIAVNVDTGTMAWAYQTSPRDTHDWDSAQTPILVDAEFGGRARKLVMTGARDGYFFVLDRVTGEHLLTTPFAETMNWTSGVNAKGQPIPNPKKDPSIGGSLVSMSTAGAVNWQPPSFSPQTGLFYLPVSATYAEYYLTETDPRGAMGLGGMAQEPVAQNATYLAAIDYKTGKPAWKHVYPGTTGSGGNGVLSTAGGLVFAGDISGNIVGYDAATGAILWHARLGSVSNAPQTYSIDGRQHLLVASGDTLFAFALLE